MKFNAKKNLTKGPRKKKIRTQMKNKIYEKL
jgi:hypothetical protein